MSRNAATVISFFIPASKNVLTLGKVYCYRVNTCHKREGAGRYQCTPVFRRFEHMFNGL